MTYKVKDCVIIDETNDELACLSNITAGYSLNINDIIIPTAEHLYQVCKFPHASGLQLEIISEANPVTAKALGNQKNKTMRKDWDKVQFQVMKWVLEVKLSQNWRSFGKLLKESGDRQIVALTPESNLWGATKSGSFLNGTNALGCLLMELRKNYVKFNNYPVCINPVDIDDFLLFDSPIGPVCNYKYQAEIAWGVNSINLPPAEAAQDILL